MIDFTCRIAERNIMRMYFPKSLFYYVILYAYINLQNTTWLGCNADNVSVFEEINNLFRENTPKQTYNYLDLDLMSLRILPDTPGVSRVQIRVDEI